MEMYWVFIVLIAPLLVWGMISPRGQWKALSSWQFRNPEANEPSETAFAVTRVVSGIALVVVVVMGFVTQQAVHEAGSTSDEPTSSVEDNDYLDDDYDSYDNCDIDEPAWPNC